MNVKLNAAERIGLLGLLPSEGNFVTLTLVRETQNKLSFSEEEHKEFEIKVENDKVSWNRKGSEEKEFELSDVVTKTIISGLNKLERDGKLTFNHYTLYKKFIEDLKSQDEK